MSYDRDRAMREQEATEAMIRMRDPAKAIKRTRLPDDDEPKTYRELAESAIMDLRRYAHDEGPERRLVSANGYEERLALLDNHFGGK